MKFFTFINRMRSFTIYLTKYTRPVDLVTLRMVSFVGRNFISSRVIVYICCISLYKVTRRGMFTRVSYLSTAWKIKSLICCKEGVLQFVMWTNWVCRFSCIALQKKNCSTVSESIFKVVKVCIIILISLMNENSSAPSLNLRFHNLFKMSNFCANGEEKAFVSRDFASE